jgi:hypothetical protein
VSEGKVGYGEVEMASAMDHGQGTSSKEGPIFRVVPAPGEHGKPGSNKADGQLVISVHASASVTAMLVACEAILEF